MLKSDNPLVSVLLPVFNAEHFIKRCIYSLLSQTYSNIEIIVIDDGSTDNTYNILIALRALDSRIKLYRQRNQGLTKSLNIGSHYANGELLARQDADDVSLPHRFELQVKEFRSKYIDFCCSRTFFMPKMHASPSLRYYLPRGASLLFENVFIHGTYMISRTTFNLLNGYCEKYKYSQDYDFVARLLEAGFKYSYLSSALYISYSPPSSISQSKRSHQQQLAREIKNNWRISCLHKPSLLFR